MRIEAKPLARLLLFTSIGALLCAFTLPSAAEVERRDTTSLSETIGVPLYEWRDDGTDKPKGIVVAVHGFAQDASAMSKLAQSLARQGYLVIAPDLRGHGRWGDTSSNMKDNLNSSCDDAAKLLSLVRKHYKKVPIYCVGESTGSGIVLRAVAKSHKGVRGVIICAAGFQPSFHNPNVMGSKFIKGMATLFLQVDITSYLRRYLSDDARVAQEMIDGPLSKKSQSALQLLGTMTFINEMPLYASKLPASIPVLVLQGSADQIVVPESAVPVFQALRSKNKEFIMVEGSGHILVGTSYIKPQVQRVIDDWLARY